MREAETDNVPRRKATEGVGLEVVGYSYVEDNYPRILKYACARIGVKGRCPNCACVQIRGAGRQGSTYELAAVLTHQGRFPPLDTTLAG